MRTLIRQKILLPLLNQLKQGITPEKLAMSTAVGSTVGIFPIPGVTTSLCFFFGVFFKLNHPTLQIVNYALTPVHFLMIPVFIRTGESIFHQPHLEIGTISFELIAKLGSSLFMGIFAWFIIVPPVGFVIYQVALRMFRKKQKVYEAS